MTEHDLLAIGVKKGHIKIFRKHLPGMPWFCRFRLCYLESMQTSTRTPTLLGNPGRPRLGEVKVCSIPLSRATMVSIGALQA